MSARKVLLWLGPTVAVASLAVCLGLAIAHSDGVVAVSVTPSQAQPAKTGIRDRVMEMAAPKTDDYNLRLKLKNGGSVDLGTKHNATPGQGMTWNLGNAVSVADVMTVELRTRALVGSKPLAEVPLILAGTTSGDYAFTFQTERSFRIGVESFFATPIGKMIAAAFFIAVLLFLFSLIAPYLS